MNILRKCKNQSLITRIEDIYYYLNYNSILLLLTILRLILFFGVLLEFIIIFVEKNTLLSSMQTTTSETYVDNTSDTLIMIESASNGEEKYSNQMIDLSNQSKLVDKVLILSQF